MKYRYLFGVLAAAAIAIPATSAQNIEPTLVNPTPGMLPSEYPTTFTLQFADPMLTINSITSNANPVEADGTWTGIYPYCEIAVTPDNAVKSQPLNLVIDANEKTVTLTLATDKSQDFLKAMQDNANNFYNFNLVLPEGLFSVNHSTMTVDEETYQTKAASFAFSHLGNWELITPKCDPADKSKVTSIKNFTLDFSNSAEAASWKIETFNTGVNLKMRPVGASAWEDTRDINIGESDDIAAQKLTLSGIAITLPAQYALTVPCGTFRLTALDASGNAVKSFTNPDMKLRYAIGEEVSDFTPKSVFFDSCIPAEGNINLINYPSGVEYIRMVFKEVPEINRNITEPIELYIDGNDKPLYTIQPSDERVFFVRTQGIQNAYGHEIMFYFTGGEQNIADRGDYTVKFPAQLFTLPSSGEATDAFELKYHIDATLSYRMYPEQEAKLNELDKITLTFTNAEKVELNPECKEQFRLIRDLSANVKSQTSIDGKVVTFSFDKLTAPGYYEVKIPGGLFNVTIGDEVLTSQVIEKVFYINESVIPAITPAEGTLSSNKIDKVTLTLPEEEEIIYILPNSSYNRLYPIGEDGEPDYDPNKRTYFSVQNPEESLYGNVLTLVPTNGRAVELKPGNYIFITAQYLYTLYGGAQPGEAKYYWTALGDTPLAAKPTINPAEGSISNLGFFTLTLADGEVKDVNNVFSYIYPVNKDNSYGPAVATLMPTPGTAKNEVDLTAINNISAPTGEYALVTPKGLFTTADKQADSYTFKFTLTNGSVEGIAADNGLYNVYTIEGVKVISNGTADDVNNLSNGFYIINGKKVCVVR